MAGSMSEHVHRSYRPHALELVSGGEQGASSRAKGLPLAVLLGLEQKGFLCLLHVAHVPMATAVFATVAAAAPSPHAATADYGTAVKSKDGNGVRGYSPSTEPPCKAKTAVVRDPVYGFVSPVVRSSVRSSVR